MTLPSRTFLKLPDCHAEQQHIIIIYCKQDSLALIFQLCQYMFRMVWDDQQLYPHLLTVDVDLVRWQWSVLKSFVKSSGEIKSFHSNSPSLTWFTQSGDSFFRFFFFKSALEQKPLTLTSACDMLQKQGAKIHYLLYILIRREVEIKS